MGWVRGKVGRNGFNVQIYFGCHALSKFLGSIGLIFIIFCRFLGNIFYFSFYCNRFKIKRIIIIIIIPGLNSEDLRL